ncbi:MAG: hypothetical protein ACE5IG_02615 [Dehalococcoidia bacterium]
MPTLQTNPTPPPTPTPTPTPAATVDYYSVTLPGQGEFSVGSGGRDVFEFTVPGPGTLTATAQWSGTAESLSLPLSGPGEAGFYARADGSSPLTLTFQFTAEVLANGTEGWDLSVLNFGGGRATGTLTLDFAPEG